MSTKQFASPLTERDFGDAVRTVFGSREEIAEWFSEWEAMLVETVNKAVEQARRTRDAEWPVPPNNHPPAADDPAPPVLRNSKAQD